MEIPAELLPPLLAVLKHTAAHQRATERALKRLKAFDDFQADYDEELARLDTGQIQHWSVLRPGQSIPDTELTSLLQSFSRNVTSE